MSTTETTIETLNDLIETCKDGQYGFRTSAEHAKSPQLKSTLEQRAGECAQAATELQAMVSSLGGKPDTSGSITGDVHRGWVAVRAALTKYDDRAVLEECERGEDSALDSYRDALKKDLTADVRNLVQKQYEGVKRNHDTIRRLRDAAKAA